MLRACHFTAARLRAGRKARSPAFTLPPRQIAGLSADGKLTPAVGEAALTLLQLFKSRGVESAILTTMQMVAVQIGEALARQHAPPTTRLVETLALLDLGIEAEEDEARRLMSEAFAPGGVCTRDAFIEDVTFFLEARRGALLRQQHAHGLTAPTPALFLRTELGGF